LAFFLDVSLAVSLGARIPGAPRRLFRDAQLRRRLPIELNTDKVWLGAGETGSAKNGSKPAHRRTRPAKAPSILNCG